MSTWTAAIGKGQAGAEDFVARRNPALLDELDYRGMSRLSRMTLRHSSTPCSMRSNGTRTSTWYRGFGTSLKMISGDNAERASEPMRSLFKS